MLRSWKTLVDSGIQLSNHISVNSIMYADDLVIIQKNEDALQKSIFMLDRVAIKYNLKISTVKTKSMAFKGKNPFRTKIELNRNVIEQVKNFNYLGNDVTYDTDNDVYKKISNFMRICGTIHRNLKNKTRQETRIKFYNTIAVPTLLYGSENWIHTRKMDSRIQAAEMRFLRNVFGCTRLDRIRNTDIRSFLSVTPLNEKIIQNRRNWCSHLNRMPSGRIPLEAYNYRPTGKREVGRPRKRWVPEQVN